MFNWTKKIHLVRGIAGEGKSSLALDLVNGNMDQVVENDDYWLFPTDDSPLGYKESTKKSWNWPIWFPQYSRKLEYRYEPKMTHLAGYWCGAEAFRRLRVYNTVAVANTFVKREHIFPYIEEARKLQILVEIHRPSTPWTGNIEECFKRNVHSVPKETIERMASQWEEITQEEINVLLELK